MGLRLRVRMGICLTRSAKISHHLELLQGRQGNDARRKNTQHWVMIGDDDDYDILRHLRHLRHQHSAFTHSQELSRATHDSTHDDMTLILMKTRQAYEMAPQAIKQALTDTLPGLSLLMYHRAGSRLLIVGFGEWDTWKCEQCTIAASTLTLSDSGTHRHSERPAVCLRRGRAPEMEQPAYSFLSYQRVRVAKYPAEQENLKISDLTFLAAVICCCVTPVTALAACMRCSVTAPLL